MTLPSGNSLDHLAYFLEKLRHREPFAIIRPNDGEYLVLQGRHFTNIDNWTYRGGQLQIDLKNAILLAATLPNTYVGIPCRACWTIEQSQWYVRTFGLNDTNLTYGNLVCNRNWRPFINYFKSSKHPIYYIGPGVTPTTELTIIDRYYVNPYQIQSWDENGGKFVEDVVTWVRDKISTGNDVKLFMFSAGPLTKILIPRLAQKFPQHQYIDAGSSLDLFLKGGTNRDYIREGQTYTNIVCDHQNGHITI